MENACASCTDVNTFMALQRIHSIFFWTWLPCDLWKIFLHSAPLNSPITTLSCHFWLPNFIHTLWGTFRHKWHANANKAHGYTLFILYSSFPHVQFFHCWECGWGGVLSLKKQCRTAQSARACGRVFILLFQLWCVCYYDGMGIIARKDHACTMMSGIMKLLRMWVFKV